MREPAVAGMFYPKGSGELREEVESLLSKVQKLHKAAAGVAPHAGYAYSGQAAATTFANLSENRVIVLLGPDHTGASLGETCICHSGPWMSPLGPQEVDSEMAEALQGVGSLNNSAHNGEHSIEVQIPFVQTLFPGSRIVPIMMGDQNIDVALGLGKKLSEFDCTVVASSDFSHYVAAEKAEDDDLYAIGALKKLDVEGFYERVVERQLSACGVGPIAAATEFAKGMGARRGVLLDYRTSAEVTGEESCVGYASIVFV